MLLLRWTSPRWKSPTLKKIVEDASQITTEAKEIVAVVDEVTQRLNGLTEQLVKENTVGALINDTAFYGELRSTVRTADSCCFPLWTMV